MKKAQNTKFARKSSREVRSTIDFKLTERSLMIKYFKLK